MCVHGEWIVCSMRADRVRVGYLRRLFTACAVSGAGPSTPGVWMYLASLCAGNFLLFGCARQNEGARMRVCRPTSARPPTLRLGRMTAARPLLVAGIRLCPVTRIVRPRRHPSAISDVAPLANTWVVRRRWWSAPAREVSQRALARVRLRAQEPGDRWAGLTGTGLGRVAHLQGKPPRARRDWAPLEARQSVELRSSFGAPAYGVHRQPPGPPRRTTR